jgi:hypothetical protein
MIFFNPFELFLKFEIYDFFLSYIFFVLFYYYCGTRVYYRENVVAGGLNARICFTN